MEAVLRVRRQLEHGEVLVHMRAACVNDEDLLRVQTSLAVLNDFAPFNRTANKWEEEALPAPWHCRSLPLVGLVGSRLSSGLLLILPLLLLLLKLITNTNYYYYYYYYYYY